MQVDLVGIDDKQLEHNELNSSHKVSIGVNWENLSKNSLLNYSIVSLIDSVSALFHRMIFLGFG